MRQSSSSASLTSHVSLLMFAKTIGFAFSIALPLIVVRRLDQTEFGLYKQTFLAVATSVSMLPLGFGMSAYYYLPREPEHRLQTVFNIVLFNLAAGLIALTAFCAYPRLMERLVGSTELLAFAPLIGLTIFLWIFASFLDIVPIANGEVKQATAFIICSQITRTALLVGAAAGFGTLRSLIYAAILHGVFQSCFLLVYLRSRFPGFWRHFDFHVLRGQLSYSIPLGLGGVVMILQTDVHNYIVSNRFGPALFAIYSVGVFNVPLMGLLQEATTAVLIPRIGVLQQENDTREIIAVMARAARKLAAVYFAVYALMMVVGREFVVFLFTERYRESWPIFAINLTLLPIAIFLQDPLFRAYASERFFLLRFRILVLLVLLACLFIATARFGLIGAISALVAVTVVERMVIIRRFLRILHARWDDLRQLADVAKLALAAALAAAATAAMRQLFREARPFTVLAVCGAVFTIVYVAMVLLLKIPTREEKQLVLRRLEPLVRAFANEG